MHSMQTAGYMDVAYCPGREARPRGQRPAKKDEKGAKGLPGILGKNSQLMGWPALHDKNHEGHASTPKKAAIMLIIAEHCRNNAHIAAIMLTLPQ